jgi:dihydrofolate synthase/folylpolyglutamate synthase
MEYLHALAFLESQTNYEKKVAHNYTCTLKLSRIEKILALLGNPHESYPSVHIAGTNGKGSTARFLASLLSYQGLRVGLYTSPHLADIRERICINGTLISKRDFASSIHAIQDVCNKHPFFKDNETRLTYFELLTVSAFLYFKKQNIDICVCEVGLGGRLDATNVLPSAIQIITPIGFDHCSLLGNTLEKIAAEKGGIIKNGSLVISARHDKSVRDVLAKKAQEKGSSFSIYGESFSATNIKKRARGWQFDVCGYQKVKILFLPSYQIENAALALCAFKELSLRGIISIKVRPPQKGCYAVEWPGRFEVMNVSPMIIVDGAHNVHGTKALVSTIKELYPRKKIFIIYGTAGDKEYELSLKELRALSSSIVLTTFQNERAELPEKLSECASKIFDTISMFPDIKNALRSMIGKASRRDLIVITGSLYLVAEARTFLKRGAICHARDAK